MTFPNVAHLTSTSCALDPSWIHFAVDPAWRQFSSAGRTTGPLPRAQGTFPNTGPAHAFVARADWGSGLDQAAVRSTPRHGCIVGGVDLGAVENWIRTHVDLVGVIETAHERPWVMVLRVPLAAGVVWFKACAPVQAFEPRLTAVLFARWPDRVAEVLGHDENGRGCYSPTRAPRSKPWATRRRRGSSPCRSTPSFSAARPHTCRSISSRASLTSE